MNFEFEMTYLACQSCTAKIHCEACGQELREKLLGKAGILDTRLDIPGKYIQLKAEGMDEDDVLDMLEDAGVFAD